VAWGNNLLRLLNTLAKKNEPIAENTQPSKPILPKLAIAAGIKNTPAPIMLPTTKEVLVHKPNLFFDEGDVGIVVLFFCEDKIAYLIPLSPKLG
jgi:hypothetical protein